MDNMKLLSWNFNGSSSSGDLSALHQNFERNHTYIAPTYDEESSSGNRFKMKLKELHKK